MEGLLLRVQWVRLLPMVTVSTTWQGIFGSGVGIGMGHPMPAAQIPEALLQAPPELFGAAVGAAWLTNAGRGIAAATVQRTTTSASGSGASSPQVSEL